MASDVRIRRVRSLESVVWLNDRIFPGEPIDRIDLEKAVWWVARRGTTPVGFCGVRVLTYEPSAAFLCRSGVRPSARGQGLQKRFIQTRLRYLRAHTKARKAISYTTYDNTASANNLVRCGFRLYRPDTIWAEDHSLYFHIEV